MVEIKTGVFFGLFIDNAEVPLEKSGFQKLILVSNKRTFIPTCEIVFSDVSNKLIEEVTLADGVTITILLGRSIDEYDTYNFRVYSHDHTPSRATPQYRVMGILDAPKWFLEARKKPVKGTSSQAISELAGACNLKFDGDNTSDSMIWMPGNDKYCRFARDISIRGWIDGTSGMQLGLTLDGTVVYKNLTTLPLDGPVFTSGHVSGTANVIDHTILNTSGHNNTIGGYKHAVRTQDISKDSSRIDQLAATKKTQQFQINKEVKGLIQEGRIDFGLIGGCNVHDHWEDARYQNLRTAMVYSAGIEVLIDQRTPLALDLLAPFVYQAYEPPVTGEAQSNEQYSCVYYTTAKTIYIEQGNYYEKFQGYTTGTNADPDGNGSQL